VVFCNTKKETAEIAGQLCDAGIEALALHGDLEQREREQTLVRFANKSASVLVATDVAARGIDIDALDAVLNYQIARDTDVHVHRIGRTGRAGKQGVACTLVSERERFKLARLETLLDQVIEPKAIPSAGNKVRLPPPAMVTLQIDGGKKQKVRPGDILGALTAKGGVISADVGKINVFDNCGYVAVARSRARDALKKLSEGKLKGRSFRVRIIQS